MFKIAITLLIWNKIEANLSTKYYRRMNIKITYSERSELKAFHFNAIKPTFHDKRTFIVDKFIYRLPAIIYKDG